MDEYYLDNLDRKDIKSRISKLIIEEDSNCWIHYFLEAVLFEEKVKLEILRIDVLSEGKGVTLLLKIKGRYYEFSIENDSEDIYVELSKVNEVLIHQSNIEKDFIYFDSYCLGIFEILYEVMIEDDINYINTDMMNDGNYIED